jgi:hypothetical protein
MKKSKFTEQQIVFALKQAEMGITIEEVCRKMGISEADVLQLEEEIRRAGSGGNAPDLLPKLVRSRSRVCG